MNKILFVFAAMFFVTSCGHNTEVMIVNDKNNIVEYRSTTLDNFKNAQELIDKRGVKNIFARDDGTMFIYLNDGSIIRTTTNGRNLFIWTLFEEPDKEEE